MPVLQLPLNRPLVKSRDLLERSTDTGAVTCQRVLKREPASEFDDAKSLGRSLLRNMPVPHVRCESSADAEVFGCHHPNIATLRHPTKAIIWRPICIQYRTGVASL